MDIPPVSTNSYFTRRTPIAPVSSADMYHYTSPYFGAPLPFQHLSSAPPQYIYEGNYQAFHDPHPRQQPVFAPPASAPAVPAGTILHKGFFDLLALIPSTPVGQTVSRFWSGVTAQQDNTMAGARYETIPPPVSPPTSPTTPKVMAPTSPPTSAPLKKGRRISKDMISKPTGFVHLVHASDADQYEALLTRWGPDGVGKIGNPQWAAPIVNMLRQRAQARAVAQVVSALKPGASQFGAILEEQGAHTYGQLSHPAPLRVVNGMPTPTASTLTQSTVTPINIPSTSTITRIDGLPSPRGAAWPGGINQNSPVRQSPTSPIEKSKEEAAPPPVPSKEAKIVGPIPTSTTTETVITRDPDERFGASGSPTTSLPLPAPAFRPPMPKPIHPSLHTLEKAASARIYFENLYFPLLRQTPSREQRRLAMEKEMEEMGIQEEVKERLRDRWRQNETEYLRERRTKVNASAFRTLKTIGHGAFGVVSLVKEKSSGELYAMKQMRKTDMLRKGQEGHVRAERDVLKSAALATSTKSAEWIVRLIYSFQDRDNLYLVLEYMGGGDLLNLLIEKDIFEEPFTRFYIAEMILAIEQCHKQGFIHRDIKPDNFLFDPQGHIKLSDFGLATDLHWAHDTSYYEQQRRDLLHKYGIDLEDPNGIADGTKTKRMNRKDVERIMGGGDGEGGIFTWREKNRKKLAYSVCGTNSYMSPEVIRGHGYTFSCDWWSLGVITFECLYGHPPFMSNSRHVTRQKILNWKQSLKFPSRPRVSREAISFMEQLLCEPEDRLGSQTSASVTRPNSLAMQARRSGFIASHGALGSVDGAELLKAHPWFRGIDWTNIHKEEAPFKPNLRSPEDTRYFEDDIPPEPLAPANGAPADATRDPLLRDKVHGDNIMNVRKALAFAGFTHRSPRKMNYAGVSTLYQQSPEPGYERGRETLRRASTIGRGRAISM
ncbi:hypothetical protein FRC03_000163 [Tulasnella sp. 419]|nr:hypothetical protein FRC02_000457 [Tulasnella sp. 418]KAG8965792.1 hypothetical protein FRC03_000163 [Tulasnella sp. 419]